MVWFQRKERVNKLFHRTARFTFRKKFQKDGNPNCEYFGGGMYANYLNEPAERDIRAYEIFPHLIDNPISLNHIVTNIERSFEIYKEDKIGQVRLGIRSTISDIDGYAGSLGIEYVDTDKKIIPILTPSDSISNYKLYFFDFELVNQLNFTTFERGQESIMNKIIRTMSASKNCSIVLQFVFTRSIEWNKIAKNAASKLSQYLRTAEQRKIKQIPHGFERNFIPKLSSRTVTKINELSSSTYQTGKKIEYSYHQKSNSTPITLAIRGIAIGIPNEVESAIQNISAVFSSIEFVGDALGCFRYNVDQDRGYRWIENNNISSKHAMEVLQNNSNMWSDMRWGKGRDFVPFLCLTPEEFFVFVSLPTDSTLPISYRRQKIRGVNHDKMVFPLGTLI
ncbi:hypothetical protein [Candidatus Nitrosotenuis cloacae]|uniref:hypothetical protein n=1 Tax=Candidatus Nitrosotenuis cloacae TaxID=1603555 RepID=UPI00227F50CB|nr:hypothetical protein [Candidatus Nitrosotenuis cloacae]